MSWSLARPFKSLLDTVQMPPEPFQKLPDPIQNVPERFQSAPDSLRKFPETVRIDPEMAGKWLPTSYDALITWMINWVNKLNVYKTTLGIATADVTTATNDLAALQWVQANSQNLKDATQGINDYKLNLVYGPGPIGAYPTAPTFTTAPIVAVAAGIVDRISAIAARCKASASYTTAIGEDLGIEAPAPGTPPSKPEGTTGVALPDSAIQLTWVKSVFDGVRIESQRAGETTWTFIGVDTSSPFIDNRPPLVAGQAEQRRYRLRYILNDEPVGDWSDTISVSTTP